MIIIIILVFSADRLWEVFSCEGATHDRLLGGTKGVARKGDRASVDVRV